MIYFLTFRIISRATTIVVNSKVFQIYVVITTACMNSKISSTLLIYKPSYSLGSDYVVSAHLFPQLAETVQIDKGFDIMIHQWRYYISAYKKYKSFTLVCKAMKLLPWK